MYFCNYSSHRKLNRLILLDFESYFSNCQPATKSSRNPIGKTTPPRFMWMDVNAKVRHGATDQTCSPLQHLDSPLHFHHRHHRHRCSRCFYLPRPRCCSSHGKLIKTSILIYPSQLHSMLTMSFQVKIWMTTEVANSSWFFPIDFDDAWNLEITKQTQSLTWLFKGNGVS